MTPIQAEYIYSKCNNKVTIGNEQVYECESDYKWESDSQLNPCECPMLNDFELSNVHAEVLK